MEKQLSQSQKMEAIGIIAGGIAHDFNNILAAVIGYTELLEMNLPKDSNESDYARQIYKASNRAKDLVQQSQSVSRQSEKEPKLIEVSAIVKRSASCSGHHNPQRSRSNRTFRNICKSWPIPLRFIKS